MNWAFKKLYLMRMYERDIKRFRPANWCSTASGERSHRDMNAQAAFTNGREEHLELQVTRILRASSWPTLTEHRHVMHSTYDSVICSVQMLRWEQLMGAVEAALQQVEEDRTPQRHSRSLVSMHLQPRG